MIRFFAFLAVLLMFGSAATAQTFPKFTGLVVDAANVLPPEVKADLTAKLEALQKDTGRQLVVATIPDLQGYPIEDYGYRLGRAWGVGLKDANNGAILFIAPNEPKGHRGPRIEVGYGLEPYLTDAFSSQVISTDMMPRLKAGDVPGAMTAGTDALIAQLRANPDEAKARTDAAVRDFDRTHKRARSSGGNALGIGAGVIFWLMVVAFIILASSRRRSGRVYRSGGTDWGSVALWTALEVARAAAENNRRSGSSWGGGGSSWGGGGDSGSDGSWGGGGFTGGGGGSFGGGGASGDW